MAPTRIEFDRILCPVDFSEFSTRALERAVRLGNWFDARVEVLHVIPFAIPAGVGLPYFPAPPEVTRVQREQAERDVANLVAPFLGEGVPIETKVLEGEPWRAIQEEAEALPAGLLVMGTHGRSGFEHLLLGSVTEKVLRRAPCPVLTVGEVPPHPRTGPLFRRILCAADLTQASERTLEVALSLASENDARITLLHVVESLPGETGSRLYLAVPEIGPLRRDLVEQARAQLRKAVPDAARDFCSVTERVEVGSAWSEILRVADEVDADLIVMGAHTGGPLGRMLFGSTSSHVVRRAACPVLVIHETGKERPTAHVAEAVAVASVKTKGGGR
jgi:nucleotide-binding universal stress UspA family protein